MASKGPKGITKAALKRALRKNAGMYAMTARELGCDRTNVKQRVDRCPELQALCASLAEEVGDAAESVIFNSILKGEVNTALAYARMKLRHRGYTTHTELSGMDGAPLQLAPTVNINVSYVEAGEAEVL